MLFVDDLTVAVHTRSLAAATRQMQLAINSLVDWGNTKGFQFSTTKTVGIHFCRQKQCTENPQLYLRNVKIPFNDTVKILGVTFDSKLRYDTHLKQLRDKCSKRLDVLKMISTTKYGADCKSMLHLYRALVRSQLDYGSQVYGNASEKTLKIVDPVHNSGIRICTGAFRTSPIDSILVEASEPPLAIRRTKLNMTYMTKVAQFEGHPCHTYISDPEQVEIYSKPSRVAPPFCVEYASLADENGFPLNFLETPKRWKTPPWDVVTLDTDISLTRFKKSDTLPSLYTQEFNAALSNYENYSLIYTDGSKSDKGVGCAAVSATMEKKLRLNKLASNFTAELYAVLLAFAIIYATPGKNFLILTDSLSSIQALASLDPSNSLTCRIRHHLNQLVNFRKCVKFMWIPGHVGIPDNEWLTT